MLVLEHGALKPTMRAMQPTQNIRISNNQSVRRERLFHFTMLNFHKHPGDNARTPSDTSSFNRRSTCAPLHESSSLKSDHDMDDSMQSGTNVLAVISLVLRMCLS